ncbi:MAG TPA: hypothetical protein VN783_06510, partial [Thermoanaerobaculia bacterium]|nr:hypothetical protein [Thermoanaerobaculia bacterium]
MKKNLLPPLLAALGLLGGLTAPGFAATPYLVADIDPRFMSDGSGPGGFVRVGARVVFATGPDGSLWSTAGIPGDPVRLGPANLFVNPPLLAAGPRAYFTGCAGSSGATCALWTTDGTAAGTRRLTNPTFFDRLSEVLTPPGSNRSFLVLDRDRGNELWTSNGTPAGTGRVRIGAARPRELTAFSGRIFFFADGGGASGALFSSDGTMAGTRRIGAARDGGHMIPLGNRLAFSAGGMVWSTDGTSAGTRSLVALPGSQLPRLAATANGRA